MITNNLRYGGAKESNTIVLHSIVEELTYKIAHEQQLKVDDSSFARQIEHLSNKTSSLMKSKVHYILYGSTAIQLCIMTIHLSFQKRTWPTSSD